MSRGTFISFEGVDGLGKTTQMKMLSEQLKWDGYDVFETKEPGDARMGSNIGAGIRHLVFTEPSTKRLRPGVADMLFLADHIQTAGDVADAVSQGKTVLCDRYADSQLAYGASKAKASPPWTFDVFRDNFGIVPDITVLLVARGPDGWIGLDFGGGLTVSRGRRIEDISWALERAKGRVGSEAGKQDGKAWDSVEEQQTIQQAYLEQLGRQPRALAIDVWKNDSRDKIHLDILLGVSTRLRQINQLRVA